MRSARAIDDCDEWKTRREWENRYLACTNLKDMPGNQAHVHDGEGGVKAQTFLGVWLLCFLMHACMHASALDMSETFTIYTIGSLQIDGARTVHLYVRKRPCFLF